MSSHTITSTSPTQVNERLTHNVELVFFVIYMVLLSIILVVANLITLKLNSVSPRGKKILYLFVTLVNVFVILFSM
mgnify:CR=1 FL=1